MATPFYTGGFRAPSTGAAQPAAAASAGNKNKGNGNKNKGNGNKNKGNGNKNKGNQQNLAQPHLGSQTARPGRINPSVLANQGPAVAKWFAGLTPAQRQAVRAQARQGGYTLSGMMPNPDGTMLDPALRPLRPGAMAKQAQTLVDSAFKPLANLLDQREKRTMALDAKRRQDFLYYSQWAQQQRDNMDARSRAADGLLLQATQTATNAVTSANDSAVASGQALAADQAGRLGQFNGTPQAGQLQAAAQFASNSERNAAAGNVNQLAGNETNRQRSDSQAQSYIASLDASRIGDTRKELNDINDSRGELASKRGETYASTLQDLRKAETDKAANVADRRLAYKELNLKREDLNQQKAANAVAYAKWAADFTQTYGISPEAWARMNFQQRLRKRRQWARAGMKPPSQADWKHDWNHDGKVDLKDKKLWTLASTTPKEGADWRKTDWDGDGDTGDKQDYAAYKAIGGKGGGKNGGNKLTDGQRTASRTAVSHVTDALDTLKTFHANVGTKKGWANNRTPKGLTFKQKLRQAGFTSMEADLAENLRFNHGNITPHGVQIAKQLGIIHPEKVWKVVRAKAPAVNSPAHTGPPY